MSEVTEEIVEKPAHVSPSFGEVLSGATPPPPKEPEPVVESEPSPSKEPETKPPTEETPKVSSEGEKPQNLGLIKALQEERGKRQQLEQQMKALQDQYGSYDSDTGETQETERTPEEMQRHSNAIFQMSEALARQTHPDYDEKYAVFYKAAVTEGNEQLLQTVMSSDLPGEAAYQAGIMLLAREKYGDEALSNPMVLRDKIRAEIQAEMEAKAQSEKAESTKRVIAEQRKTPADLSSVRAASGDSVPEFRPKSFGEHLEKAIRR